jgi:hypothetical protein
LKVFEKSIANEKPENPDMSFFKCNALYELVHTSGEASGQN